MSEVFLQVEPAAVASRFDPVARRTRQAERELLEGSWPSFSGFLRQRQLPLQRRPLTTLQVNVGKLCNQTCRHCHVEAGPLRTEMMTRATAERVVELMDVAGTDHLDLVDITGGAPELSPVFRFLVRSARARGLRVMDRCNLTVLFEPGQEDTAEFLCDHGVEIVASLPCYTSENVEAQRGEGVFDKSISALRLLNDLASHDRRRSLSLKPKHLRVMRGVFHLLIFLETLPVGSDIPSVAYRDTKEVRSIS